jgi:NAD(P)H-nitrite reductase large subunit
MTLDAKIPDGRLEDKWRNYQLKSKLINPANKKKLQVIVVGSGLSGAGAAATLAELGYDVHCFCYQDSARRAHSVAAQGELMRPKITNTMEIAFGGCFMTPSKVVTSGRGKPIRIGWQNFLLR